MPVDLSVNGAEKFAAFGRDMREMGSKGLRRELSRGLSKATKPLKLAAAANASGILPRGGGLADRVARSRLTTSTRLGGRNPGVRITAKGFRSLRRIDSGAVRHPVFGHQDRWVQQPVTPGWFSVPMEAGASAARHEMQNTIDEVARKLGRKY